MLFSTILDRRGAHVEALAGAELWKISLGNARNYVPTQRWSKTRIKWNAWYCIYGKYETLTFYSHSRWIQPCSYPALHAKHPHREEIITAVYSELVKSPLMVCPVSDQSFIDFMSDVNDLLYHHEHSISIQFRCTGLLYKAQMCFASCSIWLNWKKIPKCTFLEIPFPHIPQR